MATKKTKKKAFTITLAGAAVGLWMIFYLNDPRGLIPLMIAAIVSFWRYK